VKRSAACLFLLSTSIGALCPADERRAAPEPPLEKEAEKKVRATFQNDYANAKPEARRALARKLLDQGRAQGGDSALRYVLWREARDLAASAGDSRIALEAVGLLSSEYAVEALDMKLKTLEALNRGARSPADWKALCEDCLSFIQELLAQELFSSTKPVLKLLASAARNAKDADLAAWYKFLESETKLLEGLFREQQAALKTLEGNGRDPAANLAVARYLCLLKGELEKALPRLALSKDPVLKGVAEKQVAKPSPAEEQLALADGWWDLSRKEHALSKDRRVVPYRYYFLARKFRALAAAGYESGGSAISDPEKQKEAALRREQAARKTTTPFIGGKGGGGFSDAPPEEGILIGLRAWTGETFDVLCIRAVQPVYLTWKGGRTLGRIYGKRGRGEPFEMVAKPGYAVGGLIGKGERLAEGFRVIFMRLEGDQLEPRDSYESAWVGGKSNRPEIRLGGIGQPVTGITGNCGDAVDSLALILDL
jgi:hypothetical protein